MLTRTVRLFGLKAWGMAAAKRRGTKKARVALAGKLASSSTSCGSMAPTSAGQTRRLQSHKVENGT